MIKQFLSSGNRMKPTWIPQKGLSQQPLVGFFFFLVLGPFPTILERFKSQLKPTRSDVFLGCYCPPVQPCGPGAIVESGCARREQRIELSRYPMVRTKT